jgi:hypothetical protein
VIAVRGVPWSDWLLLVVPLPAMATAIAYIVLVIP